MMTMLLENKVCLITGAESLRSIGYATAELFCTHGAKLGLLDIRMGDEQVREIEDSLAQKTGRRPDVLGIQCDITNASDCESAINRLVERFGTLDCLVNSAGVVKSEPMLSIREADLDLMMDVNFKGTFNLCRPALGIFTQHNKGSIINIASVAAQRGGGLVGGAHYAASKGAVISLTRTIAREFGPQGIRANVVCPSMTDTAMLDGKISQDRIKEIAESIPLRRAGQPTEIAGACLFLASDLASYVTGTTLDVNGGSHIH
jgi:NAD(P)-dependent dehydrogenase (short-subunit alcohol dehydrogenase family)